MVLHLLGLLGLFVYWVVLLRVGGRQAGRVNYTVVALS